MASNTRLARLNAERINELHRNDYVVRLTALLHNAISIKGLENLDCQMFGIGIPPKRYILDTLFNYGGIAYDKQTKLFLRYNKMGINVYGLPQEYMLIGMNGYAVQRKADEVIILRANDKEYPLLTYIAMQGEKLTAFDNAIAQNLESIRTMTIAEVDNKDQMLTLANLAESRQIGSTLVFTNKHAMAGATLKVNSTGAEFLVDKLQGCRKELWNETLATLGIASANTDKKERVQQAEVTASTIYAIDSIFTVIDTFNYDAKFGGINLEMTANTSTIDLQDNENKKEIEDND